METGIHHMKSTEATSSSENPEFKNPVERAKALVSELRIFSFESSGVFSQSTLQDISAWFTRNGKQLDELLFCEPKEHAFFNKGTEKLFSSLSINDLHWELLMLMEHLEKSANTRLHQGERKELRMDKKVINQVYGFFANLERRIIAESKSHDEKKEVSNGLLRLLAKKIEMYEPVNGGIPDEAIDKLVQFMGNVLTPSTLRERLKAWDGLHGSNLSRIGLPVTIQWLLERQSSYSDKKTPLRDNYIQILEETMSSDFSESRLAAFCAVDSKRFKMKVSDELKRFNLDKTTCLSVWFEETEQGHKQVSNKVLVPRVAKNLLTIKEIEEREPGISRFLFENFGIVDFGRYPPEMLVEQYKRFEDQDTPYGIILYPHSDWNGAFHHDVEDFRALSQQTSGRALVRIVECGSKIDVARALLNLEKRYNPGKDDKHRIAFAIIGGHGTRESIQFGYTGGEARTRLYLEDFKGPGVQRASRFFKEGASIVLASCSTGVEGGMAQELSRLIKGKVVGPSIPSHGKSLVKNMQESGNIELDVNYSGPDIRREYVNGVYIQNADVGPGAAQFSV